jgi:hypothetical protein
LKIELQIENWKTYLIDWAANWKTYLIEGSSANSIGCKLKIEKLTSSTEAAARPTSARRRRVLGGGSNGRSAQRRQWALSSAAAAGPQLLGGASKDRPSQVIREQNSDFFSPSFLQPLFKMVATPPTYYIELLKHWNALSLLQQLTHISTIIQNWYNNTYLLHSNLCHCNDLDCNRIKI